MRSTNAGFWSSADLDILYDFFAKIRLHKYKSFVDLGSGDGRVFLTASLFTKAFGIELDHDLVEVAKEVTRDLMLSADSVEGDYERQELDYDVVFIYPDKRFSLKLENKLKGKNLFVYNNVFLPNFLHKQKTYWFDQVPITRYK
jgi:SAM-dependent methyltransferase